MSETRMSEEQAIEINDTMLHGDQGEAVMALRLAVMAFASAGNELSSLGESVPEDNPVAQALMESWNKWMEFLSRFTYAQQCGEDWYGVIKEDVPWWEWLSDVYSHLDTLQEVG
jgi:hypothetical protein